MQNFSTTAPPTARSRAVIVLLLWLYLSANAFLLGAELNAELERRSCRRGPRAARGLERAVGHLGRPGAEAARPGQVAHSPRCGAGATG